MRKTLSIIAALAVSPAAAGDAIPGPVRAELAGIVDGDTVDVRAQVWPGIWIERRIRFRGIDRPEPDWRADCDGERAKAAEAKQLITALIGSGPVVLYNFDDDKYGGRFDADVLVNGQSLSQALVAAGLARPYDGGQRDTWCP